MMPGDEGKVNDAEKIAKARERAARMKERFAEDEAYWKKIRDEQRQRSFVMPECCQQMIDTATICLSVSDTFSEGDLETPPTWYIRTGEPRDGCGGSFGTAEPKCCPFCAAPVPEIEKRVTDRKIMVVTDGGYYCNTCEERCNCCRCLPPAFHWQPKGSKRAVPETPRRDDDDEEDNEG